MCNTRTLRYLKQRELIKNIFLPFLAKAAQQTKRFIVFFLNMCIKNVFGKYSTVKYCLEKLLPRSKYRCII